MRTKGRIESDRFSASKVVIAYVKQRSRELNK
jgi:hypothetical protein